MGILTLPGAWKPQPVKPATGSVMVAGTPPIQHQLLHLEKVFLFCMNLKGDFSLSCTNLHTPPPRHIQGIIQPECLPHT